MRELPCEDKGTTFYSELECLKGLDKRDNRGKRHNLSIILLGLTIALLSKRDGNLSSIQRHMKNHYVKTCAFIGVKPNKVISRSQLPLVLCKVNLAVFETHIFSFYGIKLTELEKQWFSGDGKELRGSIETGDKRGEAVVQIVAHETGLVLGETFYNGKKESEKPAIRDLIKSSGVGEQKLTLDALHFCPKTLHLIHKAGGTYLVGLKKNQGELLEDMTKASEYLPISYQHKTVEKGHGRIDTRAYQLFDIRKEYIDKRWQNSGLKTLIKVNRQRIDTKTGKECSEIGYYMTNSGSNNDKMAKELFGAVRHHWSVEVTNHIRDVTLKEDKFRTKKTIVLKQLLQSDL
jgi:predicted transposase YbfD/YdcC